jgi:hypothetical protein
MGPEGIVSKRRGSYCRSGRTRDWLKLKNPEASAEAKMNDGLSADYLMSFVSLPHAYVPAANKGATRAPTVESSPAEVGQ